MNSRSDTLVGLSAIVSILLLTAHLGVAQTATEPLGSGVPENPYRIATLENLYWIAAPDDVVPSPDRAERWAAHYILTNDLDLTATLNWNDGSGWQPIGSMSQRFTGSFDGDGYTIRNLYINRPATANQGLFGYIQDARIQNLRLFDIDLEVGHTSGGLVAYVVRGNLEDVAVTGKIVSGGSNIGGVAGYISTATLRRISVDANVQGGGQTAGLAGLVWRENEVRHVSVLGTVTGTASSIGGVAGFVQGGYPMPVIADSYSRAAVSGPNHVGGLIGYSYDHALVSGSYSSGSVAGTGASVGGLIGTLWRGTVNDCYWDMQASGVSTSAGGEGRTTAEMTYPYDATTYQGWDFDTVWAEDVQGNLNNGYPYLKMVPPMIKPVQILSPARSGKLAVGDMLRFRGSALETPNPIYLWEFSDGRSFAVREPGMVNFPTTGIVTVSYAAPEWDGNPLPDTRTYEVAPNPGDLPDLRVMGVDLPPALAMGQPVQISYTVRNVGQGPAAGWRDAVYLSRDAYLDIGDVLLGSADISHELAAGASYQGTLTVTLPGVDEGVWHLILVANDEWQVLELHRLNNEYAAPVTAQVPALVEGQSSTAS